jgi:nitrous oxidase accessory protein NosD
MLRLAALVLVAWAAPASAAAISVPGDHATLQAAVDAAAAGDEIRVAAGRHCGATLDKRVTIIGAPGATLVGCQGGPRLHAELRVGLLLADVDGQNAASGSVISGLTFDGAGVSNDDLAPLALGVFGRFADDVVVSGNRFLGTVQAITNTGGDRWTITRNQIFGLGVFGDCQRRCGGGSAIVVQDAAGDVALPGGSLNPGNRPEANTVAENEVHVTAPVNDAFVLAGVLVLGADRTVVFSNRLEVPGPAEEELAAAGVLVDNKRGGLPDVSLPGARATTVEQNDTEGSQRGVVIGGTANREELLLEGNRGASIRERGGKRKGR